MNLQSSSRNFTKVQGTLEKFMDLLRSLWNFPKEISKLQGRSRNFREVLVLRKFHKTSEEFTELKKNSCIFRGVCRISKKIRVILEISETFTEFQRSLRNL